MNALEYLKSLPRSWLPQSREGSKRGHPSNSELWRWLDKGAVIINTRKPKPNDKIVFPITELIFFPKGNRVTMVGDKNGNNCKTDT